MRRVIALSAAALLTGAALLAQGGGGGGTGATPAGQPPTCAPTAMARRAITPCSRRTMTGSRRMKSPAPASGRTSARSPSRSGWAVEGHGRQERHWRSVQADGTMADGTGMAQTHQRGVPHRLLPSSDAHVPQRHEGQRPAAERDPVCSRINTRGTRHRKGRARPRQ